MHTLGGTVLLNKLHHGQITPGVDTDVIIHSEMHNGLVFAASTQGETRTEICQDGVWDLNNMPMHQHSLLYTLPWAGEAFSGPSVPIQQQ